VLEILDPGGHQPGRGSARVFGRRAVGKHFGDNGQHVVPAEAQPGRRGPGKIGAWHQSGVQAQHEHLVGRNPPRQFDRGNQVEKLARRVAILAELVWRAGLVKTTRTGGDGLESLAPESESRRRRVGRMVGAAADEHHPPAAQSVAQTEGQPQRVEMVDREGLLEAIGGKPGAVIELHTGVVDQAGDRFAAFGDEALDAVSGSQVQ